MVTYSTIISRNVININYLVNLTRFGEKNSKIIKKNRFKFSMGAALNSTKNRMRLRICPPLIYTLM